ncbi:MAG: hypothetical protein FJ088_09045, partial [Deltaproteobacteria bacterium]|nr:hypothetical protein [Deltaproteobacteria bacterium]
MNGNLHTAVLIFFASSLFFNCGSGGNGSDVQESKDIFDIEMLEFFEDGGISETAGDLFETVIPPEGFSGAFGVFAVFTDEFKDFYQAMGMDLVQYQDWAGKKMNELGAAWSRSNLQLVWDLVEPVLGGEFDWDASLGGEKVFQAAAKHGVHYLAVFHEGSGPDEMKRGEGKQKLRNPLDNLDAYKRFVEATVERFDGDGKDDADGGVVIKHWQVGNETPGWTDSGRTAEEYVKWFEAVAEAARKADNDARLVLIASTDGGFVDPVHTAVIKKLAEDGVVFDAVDLHHWGKGDLQSSTMSAVPAYIELLEESGVSGVEIWSCEHGTYVGKPVKSPGKCDPECPADKVCVPILGCKTKCKSDNDCAAMMPLCDEATGMCGMPEQTEEDQARSLIYRYVVNRANGVKRIMWNNLAAWRCFAGMCGDFFDKLGLVADGYGPGETASDVGKPRLSFYSYKMLAERTDEKK